MSIFFIAILLYLLYRFLTGFLIPVIRTTRKVRQQFNQTNGKPGSTGPENPGASATNPSPKGANPNTSKVGEYIDFEEVK
jgi:hypothetical protein